MFVLPCAAGGLLNIPPPPPKADGAGAGLSLFSKFEKLPPPIPLGIVPDDGSGASSCDCVPNKFFFTPSAPGLKLKGLGAPFGVVLPGALNENRGRLGSIAGWG